MLRYIYQIEKDLLREIVTVLATPTQYAHTHTHTSANQSCRASHQNSVQFFYKFRKGRLIAVVQMSTEAVFTWGQFRTKLANGSDNYKRATYSRGGLCRLGEVEEVGTGSPSG